MEELQSFREAQSRLQEQITEKHRKLEQAVKKQKEQLESIQQQMILNLRTQLRVGSDNTQQDTCSQLFERSRQLSEKHEIQGNFVKELGQSFARQMRRLEKRYQGLVRKNAASSSSSSSGAARDKRKAENAGAETASAWAGGGALSAPPRRKLMRLREQGEVVSQPQPGTRQQATVGQPVGFPNTSSASARSDDAPSWHETRGPFTQTTVLPPQTFATQTLPQRADQPFPAASGGDVTSPFGPSGHVRQQLGAAASLGGPLYTHTAVPQAQQFMGVNPAAHSAATNPAFCAQAQVPAAGPNDSNTWQAVQQLLLSAQNPDVLPVLMSVVTALQSQPQVTGSLLSLLKQLQVSSPQSSAAAPVPVQQPPETRSTFGDSTGAQQFLSRSSSVLQNFPNAASVGLTDGCVVTSTESVCCGLVSKQQQQQHQQATTAATTTTTITSGTIATAAAAAAPRTRKRAVFTTATATNVKLSEWRRRPNDQRWKRTISRASHPKSSSQCSLHRPPQPPLRKRPRKRKNSQKSNSCWPRPCCISNSFSWRCTRWEEQGGKTLVTSLPVFGFAAIWSSGTSYSDQLLQGVVLECRYA